ncbi:MAG: response regulator receiver protein [Fibrobacteres bacterium]|nr:response regulator receiver protein [Fibrobacterota bacterium]
MAYNILLVDDSQTVKAVITKALIMSGVDLGTLFKAGNGAEGLEILRREKVDLVFADINMPVMGGVEMVEKMKGDHTLRGIPIVIISTEGSATRIGELEAMGIAAFLRKPFQPEDLKKTVESILGESHA